MSSPTKAAACGVGCHLSREGYRSHGGSACRHPDAAPPLRSPENKERLWCSGWMKARKWSEIVAGPKWKTFIRRFNKKNNKNRNISFNYDPLSYALNFDDGKAREDDCYRGFAVRFASVPASSREKSRGNDV